MENEEETKRNELFACIEQALTGEKGTNRDREPLTPEKIITFEGLEGLTEKEAEEIIYSLNTYCMIIYDLLIQEYNIENTNHQNQAA